MKLSEEQKTALSGFTDKVDVRVKDKIITFTEQKSGVVKQISLVSDFEDEFETSIDSSCINLIIFSNEFQMIYLADGIKFITENGTYESKVRLTGNVIQLEGKEIKDVFSKISSYSTRLSSIGKGIVLDKDCLFVNSDDIKGYIRLPFDSEMSICLNTHSLSVFNSIKGKTYENDSFLIRKEETSSYTSIVAIRKLILRDKNFCDYVRNLPVDFKLELKNFTKYFKVVTDAEKIIFSDKGIEFKGENSSVVFPEKCAEEFSISYKVVKQFIGKLKGVVTIEVSERIVTLMDETNLCFIVRRAK